MEHHELRLFDPFALEFYSMDLTVEEAESFRERLPYGDCALPAPIVDQDPGDELEEAA